MLFQFIYIYILQLFIFDPLHNSEFFKSHLTHDSVIHIIAYTQGIKYP
jgi:hypothetical protein